MHVPRNGIASRESTGRLARIADMLFDHGRLQVDIEHLKSGQRIGSRTLQDLFSNRSLGFVRFASSSEIVSIFFDLQASLAKKKEI